MAFNCFDPFRACQPQRLVCQHQADMTFQLLFLFLFWMPTTVQSSAKNKTLRIKALLPMGNDSRWLVKNADMACRLAVEHVNSQPSLLDAYNLELDTNSSDVSLGKIHLSDI